MKVNLFQIKALYDGIQTWFGAKNPDLMDDADKALLQTMIRIGVCIPEEQCKEPGVTNYVPAGAFGEQGDDT